MSSVECDYPHFRNRFWGASCWVEAVDAGSLFGLAREDEAKPGRGGRMSQGESGEGGESDNGATPSSGRSLRLLDLKVLPRDDGPPSELQLRRQKFSFYEKQCSEVTDGLYLGSESVAKNLEQLRSNGITHVVNCVGMMYGEYFKDELEYLTLFLKDTPAEDILCVLYDVFDFVEAARRAGGRVLVHCSQGVSRSATLVIAFLMWKLGRGYDGVYTTVKQIRGVANPNIGFTCQLLQWHKKRTSPLRSGCRLYRICPQSAAQPLHLVARPIAQPALAALDPRGAFVVHARDAVYTWSGALCPQPLTLVAQRVASQLHAYEAAPAKQCHVRQSAEPPELLQLLQPAVPGGGGEAAGPTTHEEYSSEYEMFRHAWLLRQPQDDDLAPPPPGCAKRGSVLPYALPLSPSMRARKLPRRADTTGNFEGPQPLMQVPVAATRSAETERLNGVASPCPL